MEERPDARAAFLDSRAAISAVNTATNRARLIVIRPLKSAEFGSSLAAGKDLSDSSLRNASKIKWRRGWDCSRPGTAAHPPLRSGPPRRGRGVQKSLRDFCRTRLVRPHILTANKKGPERQALFYWRRGWDSNPRAGITRPSDFESAPL